MCWYTEEMTMLLTEGDAMSKRVMVAAVLAVLVAGLVGCEGRTSLGGSELVQSGVQSVTICDKHHARIFHRISEKIPGSDEGVWGPEREGDCHAWYHYTASSTD
jgi:hypothetical protein